jgi:hypothetical protein
MDEDTQKQRHNLRRRALILEHEGDAQVIGVEVNLLLISSSHMLISSVTWRPRFVKLYVFIGICFEVMLSTLRWDKCIKQR